MRKMLTYFSVALLFAVSSQLGAASFEPIPAGKAAIFFRVKLEGAQQAAITVKHEDGKREIIHASGSDDIYILFVDTDKTYKITSFSLNGSSVPIGKPVIISGASAGQLNYIATIYLKSNGISRFIRPVSTESAYNKAVEKFKKDDPSYAANYQFTLLPCENTYKKKSGGLNIKIETDDE